MKNKKNLLLKFTFALSFLLFPNIVNASSEKYIDGYWYLYDNSGNKLTGFQYIQNLNKTCYYDLNGQMQYGERLIDGNWYYFQPSTGKMTTGFQYLSSENKTVYYNSKGQMLYGYQFINNNNYYFDTSLGSMAKDKVINIKGLFRYFNNDGREEKISGQRYINNHWYLFDKDGIMLTGFQYIKNQDKIVYYNANGEMLYGFQKIDNNYYYFNSITGAMQIGEQIVNRHWHLFDKDGKMLTGFQYIKNQDKTVYYNANGEMLYGFQKIGKDHYFFDNNTGAKTLPGEKYIGNYWYLFDKDGKIQTGFQYIKEQNKTVYYNEKGQMLYGQQNINGFWYNFETNTGKMLTGFQYIKNQNKTVYYNEKGQMLHGYNKLEKDYYYFDISTGEEAKDKVINVDGKFKYFNKSGKEEKVSGQKYINNHWYLFDKDGKMLTGFQNIESQNKTVYYNENGEMLYGENYIDGAWRYFDKSTGAMATGFTNVGGKIVYYDKDGKMVYGNKTIDGIDYYFNTVTGAMKDNFIRKDGNTYYYSENGKMATGWNNIAGIKYYFNNSGELIGKDVRKVIDVSAHNKKIDWDKVYRTKSVDGVIVRVSASSVYEDKMLSYNISNLKRLGIPYGLYIYSYAENGQEGREYAQFVVNEIKKYSMNPSLGIYLDLESNNITGYLDTNKYNEITRGFMDVMNNNGYGNLSRIYTYKKYANDVLNSDYLKNQIYWIAQYNNRLTYSGNYSAWQYTSSDWIDGISTKVDSSVWFAKF